MQPGRTLDQIYSSLSSVYDPQVQSIQQQQADLNTQAGAQEQGLQAQQQNAFGDILNGARRRGTGIAFGGIPLQEQAQYTAGTYMPALANLRTSVNNNQRSLSDAILGINEKRTGQANDLFTNERSFFEQQRQFNIDQQRMRDEAAATAANARSAASNYASPTFGGGGGAQPAGKSDPFATVNKQNATNAIVGLLNTNNPGVVAKTIQAIATAAQKGSVYDQFKLNLLNNYKSQPQYAKLLTQAVSGPSVARGLI